MSKEEIVEKYSNKAKEQRNLYRFCPHPDCNGIGNCLCCKNTEGCLSLAKEYEKIVELCN